MTMLAFKQTHFVNGCGDMVAGEKCQEFEKVFLKSEIRHPNRIGHFLFFFQNNVQHKSEI
jgi:hypothetical protein